VQRRGSDAVEAVMPSGDAIGATSPEQANATWFVAKHMLAAVKDRQLLERADKSKPGKKLVGSASSDQPAAPSPRIKKKR